MIHCQQQALMITLILSDLSLQLDFLLGALLCLLCVEFACAVYVLHLPVNLYPGLVQMVHAQSN